jgi:hypothetical protein
MQLKAAALLDYRSQIQAEKQPYSGSRHQQERTVSYGYFSRFRKNGYHNFDDRKMRWFNLGDFKHFVFSMYDIDRERRVVDFIVKV